jgi:hypothetical protein
MKKIYILGGDNIGWSIDKDRFYTIKAIQNIGQFKITNNIFLADIIYCVWWNKLLDRRIILLLKICDKKVIATLTNDLAHQEKDIKKILPYVNKFVYANSLQKQQLLQLGAREKNLFFNPFYVDENIFKNLHLSRQELCSYLKVDYNKIKDLFLIGSFQRDSLGSDLSKPKWQKDPDLLIKIMRNLDNRFTLVIAGPRRHYIVNQCIRYDIPYIFIGDESYILNHKDDLLENVIDTNYMPYLYNLIDLYIVSSKSEGGPKAIPEVVLCETNIISTNIGFANDLLSKESIYENSKNAVEKIKILITNKYKIQNNTVEKYYSFDKLKIRIENILKDIS